VIVVFAVVCLRRRALGCDGERERHQTDDDQTANRASVVQGTA
jgi:hypothetical protein